MILVALQNVRDVSNSSIAAIADLIQPFNIPNIHIR